MEPMEPQTFIHARVFLSLSLCVCVYRKGSNPCRNGHLERGTEKKTYGSRTVRNGSDDWRQQIRILTRGHVRKCGMRLSTDYARGSLRGDMSAVLDRPTLRADSTSIASPRPAQSVRIDCACTAAIGLAGSKVSDDRGS
jgi:hypothetical protein